MNEIQIIEKNNTTRKVALVIYILYLASLILPILLLVGVILGYIFENDANLSLKTHYKYLIRSFWIGLLYFTIAALSILILIGFILVPLSIIWWIIRLVKGCKSLLKNEPVLNPETWIF